MACVLLTGATGYIASHTWLALQEAGHEVIGIDSLVNSSIQALSRLETISGRKPMFVQGDVRDAALRALDASHPAAALVVLEAAYCALRGMLNRLARLRLPRAA